MPAAGEWFEKTMSKSARRRRKFCRKKAFFYESAKRKSISPGERGTENPPPGAGTKLCIVQLSGLPSPPGTPGVGHDFRVKARPAGLIFL